jgi:hypothetical protein
MAHVVECARTLKPSTQCGDLVAATHALHVAHCMSHVACCTLVLHAVCCMLHVWHRPTVLDGAAPSLNAAQRSAKVITMVEEFCAHFPLRRAKFKDTAVCCPDATPSGIPIGYHAERDTMPSGIPCRAGYHAERDTMPSGIPCRVGYHAEWDTMPSGIPCCMRKNGMLDGVGRDSAKRKWKNMRMRSGA